jgi:hypothetical protein
MEETMNPDDVLVGIGHFMQKRKRGFEYRVQKFSGFFYKNKDTYTEVLGRFMFNTNGTFPTSEELEQARMNLACSRMLHFSFSFPNYYQFDNAVDVSYEKHVSKRISLSQRKALEELAKKFESEFGTEERFRLN